MGTLRPLCVDCLRPEVTVQVVDQWGQVLAGFCRRCWDANQRLAEAIQSMLAHTVTELEELP